MSEQAEVDMYVGYQCSNKKCKERYRDYKKCPKCDGTEVDFIRPTIDGKKIWE